MASQRAATTRKSVLLAQKIQCSFCDTLLTPQQFKTHEHEDIEAGRYWS